MFRNLSCQRIAEILSHDVPAKRQGESSLAKPPLAKVLNEVQAPVGEGELSFVDQEPDIHLTLDHRVLDLVERYHDGLEFRLEQAKREVGAGERSGDGDALAL